MEATIVRAKLTLGVEDEWQIWGDTDLSQIDQSASYDKLAELIAERIGDNYPDAQVSVGWTRWEQEDNLVVIVRDEDGDEWVLTSSDQAYGTIQQLASEIFAEWEWAIED